MERVERLTARLSRGGRGARAERSAAAISARPSELTAPPAMTLAGR